MYHVRSLRVGLIMLPEGQKQHTDKLINIIEV